VPIAQERRVERCIPPRHPRSLAVLTTPTQAFKTKQARAPGFDEDTAAAFFSPGTGLVPFDLSALHGSLPASAGPAQLQVQQQHLQHQQHVQQQQQEHQQQNISGWAADFMQLASAQQTLANQGVQTQIQMQHPTTLPQGLSPTPYVQHLLILTGSWRPQARCSSGARTSPHTGWARFRSRDLHSSPRHLWSMLTVRLSSRLSLLFSPPFRGTQN
jgi:hypothetical protein